MCCLFDKAFIYPNSHGFLFFDLFSSLSLFAHTGFLCVSASLHDFSSFQWRTFSDQVIVAFGFLMSCFDLYLDYICIWHIVRSISMCCLFNKAILCLLVTRVPARGSSFCSQNTVCLAGPMYECSGIIYSQQWSQLCPGGDAFKG